MAGPRAQQSANAFGMSSMKLIVVLAACLLTLCYCAWGYWRERNRWRTDAIRSRRKRWRN
jgi:hypothetical protein